MKYSTQKMNLINAEIISTWKYPKPYDIYSMNNDEQTIDELMHCNYFSIHLSTQLIGYYCSGQSAQVPTDLSKPIYEDNSYVDIGLGMDPELTGKGQGKNFLSYTIECAKNSYPDKNLRLTVAKFNKRAIHLYKGFGFKQHFSFIKPDSDTEFIIMLLS